ncbi:MAG: hypothetical protein JXR40_10365 [Pontiellaceae bacterium]|nr:hypothetical protein [Pontiellaceae bacterium]
MNQKKCILLLVLMATNALAYNENHGPFPDDAKIEQVKLTQLSRKTISTNETANTQFAFSIPEQQGPEIRVELKENVWFTEILLDGKTVMKPTAFSPNPTTYGMEAYTADLNKDQRPDFIVYSFSGGNGLASGSCNVAFLLSSEKTYALTIVTTLFPDESDFVVINKKPYFIHTTLLGVDSCNDEKNHNFWIYNLLTFDTDKIRTANSAHIAFPKTIWYSFEPNHSETVMITDSQKAKLQKKVLTQIYWRNDD